MHHDTEAQAHAFRLDTAIMRNTAFSNFADLLETCARTPYYPSLRSDLMEDGEADLIGDAFDAAMAAIGDKRRAHRS